MARMRNRMAAAEAALVERMSGVRSRIKAARTYLSRRVPRTATGRKLVAEETRGGVSPQARIAQRVSKSRDTVRSDVRGMNKAPDAANASISRFDSVVPLVPQTRHLPWAETAFVSGPPLGVEFDSCPDPRTEIVAATPALDPRRWLAGGYRITESIDDLTIALQRFGYIDREMDEYRRREMVSPIDSPEVRAGYLACLESEQGDLRGFITKWAQAGRLKPGLGYLLIEAPGFVDLIYPGERLDKPYIKDRIAQEEKDWLARKASFVEAVDVFFSGRTETDEYEEDGGYGLSGGDPLLREGEQPVSAEDLEIAFSLAPSG